MALAQVVSHVDEACHGAGHVQGRLQRRRVCALGVLVFHTLLLRKLLDIVPTELALPVFWVTESPPHVPPPKGKHLEVLFGW